MSKPRLVLAFGGRSSEHDVSVRGAAAVWSAIDRERWTPILVGVGRDGALRVGERDFGPAEVVASGPLVRDLRDLAPDVVFPLLHGPHGEDGSFQGHLEMLDLPYVGSGVLASAICMDKAILKRLATLEGIPVVHGIELAARATATTADHARRVLDTLAPPLFVKPANQGSSIGVSRVGEAAALLAAIEHAFRYDDKLVVEQALSRPREIEVAVLGSEADDLVVSAPGEIILPEGIWYDYETKYFVDVASYAIPAELPFEIAEHLRAWARRAFLAAGCQGLARVDFLVDRATKEVFLNEVNTMPGFTSISMYPKLMAHAGIPFGHLVTRLAELGIARHARRRTLSSAPPSSGPGGTGASFSTPC
jgi:D-alanine-D-alanine ligase